MKKNFYNSFWSLHWLVFFSLLTSPFFLKDSFSPQELGHTEALQSANCNPAFIELITKTTDSICPGTTVFLTVAGELNDAENWYWYTDSCGGEFPNYVGSLITVLPDSTTTYYCRGEGGCLDGTDECYAVTVTVIDTISPSISCIGNQVGILDDNCEYELPDYRSFILATDNCVTPTLTQIPAPGTLVSDNMEITVVAIDEFNNTDTCRFSLVLSDPVAPTAICQDLTVELGEAGTVLISSEQIDDGSNDACGDIKLRIDRNQFNCDDIGRQEVTLTVEDRAGNISTCDAIVKVEDNLMPTVDCGQLELSFDANGSVTVTVNDLPVIAEDNCGVDLIEAETVTFNCNDAATQQIAVSITDFSANQTTCSVDISLLDTSFPTIQTQDFTVALDEQGQATITTQEADNGSSDNCGIDRLWLSQTAFDCSEIGSNVVQLFGEDKAGNESSSSFMVEVIDNIAPVPDCGSNREIIVDASCAYLLPNYTNDIGATDNCNGAISIEQLPAPGTQLSGINTVSFSVKDASGNEALCSFDLTPIDNTKPEVNCPPAQQALILENCEAQLADYTSMLSVNDNCGTDQINIVQSPDIGTTITTNTLVILTVTDNAGNESLCSLNIEIQDKDNPQYTCPDDQSVYLDNNCEASIPDFIQQLNVQDNCLDDIIIVQEPLSGTVISENTKVELTVTDKAGNQTACSFSVNPLDTIAPVLNCQNVIFLPMADNNLAELRNNDLLDIATDNCGLQHVNYDISSFDCNDIGYNAVEVEVLDLSGNKSSCTLTVGITASGDCDLPTIMNSDDNIVGKGDGQQTVSIDPPCSCMGNGNFSEELVIGPAKSGQQWRVKSTDLLNINTLQTIEPGTLFTEVSIGDDLSIYRLKGVHKDGQGYSLEAESNFYPGRAVSISNTCYYPSPAIIDLEGPYCTSDAPIILKGIVADGVEGEGVFTINNRPATEFDPAVLGPGNHIVEFTWNAGSYGEELQPSNIGCTEKVGMLVQVSETSPNFACNGFVRVNADEACEAIVTPQMVLSGEYVCFDDYQVRIYDDPAQGYIPNPIPARFFGRVLNVIVEHVPTGRFCEGELLMEDKIAPIIDCPTEEFNFVCTDFDSLFSQEKAFEAIGFDPLVDIYDACQERFNVTVNWIDNFIPSDDECLDYGVINRIITATDAAGNTSEQCEISFKLTKPELQTDLIEEPFFWDACGGVTIPLDENGNPDPEVTGSPYFINGFGDTVFVYNQAICNLFVAYSDNNLEACGNSIEILRTWEYADWCDPTNIIRVEQLIYIVDQTAPQIIVPTDTLLKSTGPFDCTSAFLIPEPEIIDCNTVSYIAIIESIVPATDRFGVVIPGQFDTIPLTNNISGNDRTGYYGANVPTGPHFIAYKATDDCGNISEVIRRPLKVEDRIAPVAICGDDVNFSLGGNGIGQLIPADVDKGSRDNCGEVSLQLRRIIDEACLDSYVGEIIGRQSPNPITFADLTQEGNNYFFDGALVLSLEGGTYYSAFAEEVFFTCCDVGSIVSVQMEVTDNSGNTNYCWINVTVEDKIRPVATPPAHRTVNCDDLLLSEEELNDTLKLQQFFGNAQGADNCSAVTVELTPSVNMSSCNTGRIIRRFQAIDPSGNISGTVQQQIDIVTVNNYEIKFPADARSAECGVFGADTIETNVLACDQLAINVEDDRFIASGDECYKIFRTYQVINDCEYDGVSEPVTISRDANGDNIPGETIYLLRRNDRVYLDNNNDETDGFIQEVTSIGFWRYVQMINVYDTIPPQIDYEEPTPFCALDDNCTGFIDIPFSVNDLCSPNDMRVEVFLDLNADNANLIDKTNSPSIIAEGLNYLYTDEAPIGNHQIIVKVSDGCGNTTSNMIPFSVVDCKVASPICQGISVELMPLVNSGIATGVAMVPADALLGSLDDTGDCSGSLRISVHKASETVIDPAQDTLVFTCEDTLNTAIPVLVYVWDDANNPYSVQPDGTVGGPNYAVCETFVILQDNQFNLCAVRSFSDLLGSVRTEEGSPIEGVMIQLSGELSDSITTNIEGQYNFTELEQAYDYSLKPELNHSYINGVSTIDLLLISKHILGVKPLDSPYKLIAADANNSGSVTTFDIIQLRKLILSLDSELSNNKSWRFVEASHAFPNPTNPWLVPLPEVVSLNNLNDESVVTDFIGIKIGDVNSNAQTSSLIHSERNRTKIEIELEEQLFEAGDLVTVSFDLDQIYGSAGYQYTLDFDTDFLELIDVEYGLAGQANFGWDAVQDGLITTSWHSPASEGIQEDELYTLVFRAKNNGRLSELLQLNSRLTSAEVYSESLQVFKPQLLFKGSNINHGNLEVRFKVGQNYPNPFSGQTLIDFTIPEAGMVYFSIYDLNGRIIRQLNNIYDKGTHQLQLDAADLPNGILYYSLQIGKHQALKKMIVIED